MRFDAPQVGIREISLVSLYLSHVEPHGGIVQQSGHHRGIVDVTWRDLDGK